MRLAKTATLLGLIGVSIILFRKLISFFRMLEYGDVLSISLMLLTLIGFGLLLTFFIMMFVYYRRQLLDSNE